MKPARGNPLKPILWFAAAYLALGLVVRNEYYQLMLTLVLVWAIMGVAWNVFSGYSGLVSFGHASFFGLGVTLIALSWFYTRYVFLDKEGRPAMTPRRTARSAQ